MKIQRTVLVMTCVWLISVATMAQAGGRYDVAPVTNQQYQDECGVCHFAYQPGLLPAESWRKVMSNLADHFGENAELPEADRQSLLTYLEQNSADKSHAYLSRKVMRSLPRKGIVMKISELGFIAHEHKEIPRRVFKGNLQGLTNCDACHQRAGEGSYNEHEVRIPGYGRWDD